MVMGSCHLKHRDGLPVDDKVCVFSFELAMDGIELEHLYHTVEVNEGVIDVDNSHFSRVESLVPGHKFIYSELHQYISSMGTQLVMQGKMHLYIRQRGTVIFIFKYLINK